MKIGTKHLSPAVITKFKRLFKRLFSVSTVIQYILIIFFISGISFVSFFLYNNVYLSLEAADKLNKIKQNISDTSLNIELFDEVSSNLNEKLSTDETNVHNLNNPFEVLEEEVEPIPKNLSE